MTRSEILFVDDEKDILDLGASMLRKAGYSVQSAISGDIAYILIEQGLLFDLLVTDVMMPGLLDGFALAKKVRGIIPELPIVYSTGYGEAARIRALGAPEGRLLVKPWRRQDLLQAVVSAMTALH